MQHKPSEPTHKLLCRHSQGDENTTLCRVNTRKKKKNSKVGGTFQDTFVAKAGKPQLEDRLPEGSKGSGKPQAGTALRP